MNPILTSSWFHITARKANIGKLQSGLEKQLIDPKMAPAVNKAVGFFQNGSYFFNGIAYYDGSPSSY